MAEPTVYPVSSKNLPAKPAQKEDLRLWVKRQTTKKSPSKKP